MKSCTARLALLAGASFASPLHAEVAIGQVSDQRSAPVAVVPTQTDAAVRDEGLEEIIVTAQRRRQNLQDVPIAVSAVTAEMAARLGVGDPQSVTQLVPGFTFQRQAGGATPFVRGVGSTSSFIGNEPSVAIFVDDTYIPSGNAAVFEFNNIELVEVLKGPQGTLFGRNATGGVVHVRTREPSYELTGDVSVGYANYDSWIGQAYISGGLTDKIAINVAAFGADQGQGWGRNIVTGRDILLNESWGVRSKVLIEPDDLTKVILGGLYSERRSDQGMATRVVDGYFGFAGYSPQALGAGFFDGATTQDQFYKTRYYQFSANVTRHFENATLVSITAYGKVDTFFLIDLDAAPINVLNAEVDNSGKTTTQEFQLLSRKDSALQWILGAYFLKDTSYFGLRAFGAAVPFPGFSQFAQDKQETTSLSGFAQASGEIVPRVNLTIGVRYTSDRRAQSEGGASIARLDGTVLALPNGARLISGPFASKETFDSLTGRLSLDYKVSDDLMVYAAFNRGFKSGVFNLPGYSTSSTAPLPAVLPEDLNAYTAGFKSEFADSRVRLNVEGFYYDYKNIQVQNNVPPPNAGTILTNGGAATIKGFDAELTVRPTRDLTLTANIAYVDGKYDSFLSGPTFFPLAPNAPIPIPAGCGFTAYPTGGPAVPAAQRNCDLSGNKTVNTPPFSSAVAILYSVPTDIGELGFAASYVHGGNYFSEPDNLRFVKQPKTDIFNASIRWTTVGERFDVRLHVNNLTNERYYSYLANSATSGPKGSPAAPRTYGITLGAHF